MAGSDLNAAGKKLLKGHLRHVGFHNKVGRGYCITDIFTTTLSILSLCYVLLQRQEEDEMWKQRQRELLSEEPERSSEEAHLKLKSRIKRKRKYVEVTSSIEIHVL